MTPLCLGLELMLFGARVCLGSDLPPPRPPLTVMACPELEAWSPEEQHALAVELRVHPTPVTIAAIKRLQRARAQIRACQRRATK
jgi:hypothetical protein